MGILNLFGKNIKAKDMTFVIKICNPPSYPEKEVRWKKYGNPLCSIFNPYFEEIAVEYFKDEKGRLDQINVVCYKSKLKYKKSEENEFFANIFRIISQGVKSFFEGHNLKAYIDDVHVPSDPNLQEHIVSTFKSVPTQPDKPKKSFKPTIVKTPETGKDALIVGLDKKIDPDDMERKGMTIQRAEDGRYFVGFISKKDGKRYYMEIPEKLGKQLMNEIK